MPEIVVCLKEFVGGPPPISPREETDCWLHGLGMQKLAVASNNLVAFQSVSDSLKEKCFVHLLMEILVTRYHKQRSELYCIKDVINLGGGDHITIKFVPLTTVKAYILAEQLYSAHSTKMGDDFFIVFGHVMIAVLVEKLRF